MKFNEVDVRQLLSETTLEGFSKLREDYLIAELDKKHRELDGSCLDGDKFNPEKHILEIQVLNKTKMVDKRFFEDMLKIIK